MNEMLKYNKGQYQVFIVVQGALENCGTVKPLKCDFLHFENPSKF